MSQWFVCHEDPIFVQLRPPLKYLTPAISDPKKVRKKVLIVAKVGINYGILFLVFGVLHAQRLYTKYYAHFNTWGQTALLKAWQMI